MFTGAISLVLTRHFASALPGLKATRPDQEQSRENLPATRDINPSAAPHSSPLPGRPRAGPNDLAPQVRLEKERAGTRAADAGGLVLRPGGAQVRRLPL